jgi:hypothetical protein
VSGARHGAALRCRIGDVRCRVGALAMSASPHLGRVGVQANGSASTSHSVHKGGMFKRVKDEVEEEDNDAPADEKEEEAPVACER